MVKKDGAAASIEENAEVQAPAEEQSNVQSSTAESVLKAVRSFSQPVRIYRSLPYSSVR